MKTSNKADVVLKEIEEASERTLLPIIGPIKGRHLTDAIRKYGVKNVLEVGTFIGYSAILMSSNLADDGKVVTIEINEESAKLAEENVTRAGLADKIRVVVGNALEVIPTISEKFDMVFLDATKSEYLEYLRLAEDNLKKGGVVFADNVKIFAHDVRGYMDYVRNSGRYSSNFIDAGFDGVEVSVKLF